MVSEKKGKRSHCASDYSASQSKMEGCSREESNRIRADDVQKEIRDCSCFQSADEEYELLGFQKMKEELAICVRKKQVFVNTTNNVYLLYKTYHHLYSGSPGAEPPEKIYMYFIGP